MSILFSTLRTIFCIEKKNCNNVRTYISRAHRYKNPITYSINEAFTKVLQDCSGRKIKRTERWQRYNGKISSKENIALDSVYRNQDETIELVINLNLDPRKPGQSLRGSLILPHGSGKPLRAIIFTNDILMNQALVDLGASMAGGTELIQSIKSGNQHVNYDLAIATSDIMPSVSKISRILGPRGLTPNYKTNTIVPIENVISSYQKMKLSIKYRTELNGIIHVGIGKASFDIMKLRENTSVFMSEIEKNKPEVFGKSKKKTETKNTKKIKSSTNYYLKAYLTTTQMKGSVPIDLQTLDPSSLFFMGESPESK